MDGSVINCPWFVFFTIFHEIITLPFSRDNLFFIVKDSKKKPEVVKQERLSPIFMLKM